jgi:hypothetical protein
MPPAAKKSSPAKGSSSSPGKSDESIANKAFSSPLRASPVKGRKNKKAIKQSKPIEPGWYLRATLYQGCVMCVQITTSNFGNDAYFHPLISKIASDDEDEINLIGLLGAYYMRISLTNPCALLNASNGYQRKAFLCVLDEDEATPEIMLSKLEVIKRFLEQPENNRYGTKVFIQQPGWDLTPPHPAPLPKLDHTLQYKEIVRIINDMFDNVDGNWAVNNRDSAGCFFTAGYIPFQASADLGFPLDAVMQMITGFFSSLYMGSFHTVVQKMTNTGCLMVLGIFLFRNGTHQKGKKKHPVPHIASTKRKIF